MKYNCLAFLGNLSNEDKIFANNILNRVKSVRSGGSAKNTMFMDERLCELAEKVVKSQAYDNYALSGGYPDAKRKVMTIMPDYISMENVEFPITPVKFKFNKAFPVTHRDFLGCLMALNISRECIGDIVVGEGIAYVFAISTFVSIICEITKVGKTKVEVSCDDFDANEITTTQQFTEICGTVASMRLDCVVSVAIKLSREKTCSLIEAGNVTINHVVTESTRKLVCESDVFSVRGFGKFLVSKVGQVSKKGRLHVVINKYN